MCGCGDGHNNFKLSDCNSCYKQGSGYVAGAGPAPTQVFVSVQFTTLRDVHAVGSRAQSEA